MAQVAAAVGKFICSNVATVKYRRQEEAVTYSNLSKFSLFLWRVKRFFGENSQNLIQLKMILKEYASLFEKYLSDKDKKMLTIFTEDYFKNYFKRIFYPYRLRLKLIDELALRVLFILKKL